MIGFIVGILFLIFMLWLAFTLTGAFIGAFFWLFIKLPLALIFFILGVICCCTIILIPVGVWFFKAAISLLIPGSII